MKKITLSFFLSLLITFLSAQKFSNAIQIGSGKSWHGTGDMNGIMVDLTYKHTFKKRLDFTNGIATTIHYKQDKGFNDLIPGVSPTENLIRFTTAGIQLNSLLNYSLFYSRDNQLKVGGGMIFRFQSSSYPDIFGYYQDPRIFPTPFYVFNHTEKQNIFSPGYTFGLSFYTKISLKYETGIKVFFQNDTNGDAITYISLIFGRLFEAIHTK